MGKLVKSIISRRMVLATIPIKVAHSAVFKGLLNNNEKPKTPKKLAMSLVNIP